MTVLIWCKWIIILIFDNNIWNKDSDDLRRLVYVWMTRAKKWLLCFWEKSNWQFNDLLLYNKTDVLNSTEKNNYSIDKISLIFWLADVNIWWNKWKSFSTYLNIWKEVTLNDEWWSVMLWQSHIQWLSNKWQEEIKKYFKKWYRLNKVKIFNRLMYRTNTWEQALVYLFTIYFEKNKF